MSMADAEKSAAVLMDLPHLKDQGDAVTKEDSTTAPRSLSSGSEETIRKDNKGLRLNKASAGFFIMGLMVGLPCMVTGTSANKLFVGVTGVYEVCNSVVAAITSFGTPFVARYISYNLATWICFLVSSLAYVVCTLPRALAGATDEGLAGPVVGTMLGGFLYAFGTNMYMSLAAFFPQEAVLALSAGSALSVVLGPGIYIGITSALDQDWRRSFLIFLPTTLVIPLAWWLLLDPEKRAAAEQSRRASLKSRGGLCSSDMSHRSFKSWTEEDLGPHEGDNEARQPIDAGRLMGRGRLQLTFKTLIPKYSLPLMLCTTSAILSLMGTVPTLESLERFHKTPHGDLQFQLIFLSYGAAQFIFSAIAGIRPVPLVWGWACASLSLCITGIIQLFRPFLTYYAAWVVVVSLAGGCVGAAISNTNYKIAEDFRVAGANDEVRSFAMSFAWAGKFAGDSIGGALGVMVQRLALAYLGKGA